MLPDLTALGYFFGGVGTVTAARKRWLAAL